ncbi:MAG: prolyl oligopeptidase family serine peptidase [Clostridia bacterium]|nr:prolyl oligopeptidase family serine peptidase [Clostridia bacterium]
MMKTEVKVINSKILDRNMNVSVYIPEDYESVSLPVLYFLHGRGGNENILKNFKMDKIANKLIKNNIINPFIIVCPYIANSRGINSLKTYEEVQGKYGIVHKGLFEDYFIKEIIPFIDSSYKTIKDKNSRYIGGISAGGYAALHIGFNHQETFSKIGAHMPAIDLNYEDEDECYFENKEMWQKYDPITIAKNKKTSDLKIFLDCGNEDEGKFYIACKKLYKVLKSKSIQIENHVFKGHHNAEYIISNLEKYFRFYGGK